ncbi:MAG: DUF2380 domain-containing protein [Myxococcales bacterium]|nr:DUF2380 domain-containing protein [Myxococcales bacterium]
MKRLLLCAALLACQHSAEYRDPMAAVKADNPAYKALTVALITSENTKNSEKFVRDGGGPWGGSEANIVERFRAIFHRDFKAAVDVQKAEDARAIHADLVAVLDVQAAIRFGFHIEAQAILLDLSAAPVDTVRAEFHKSGGFGLNIPEAIEQTASQLEAALLASPKATAYASAHRPEAQHAQTGLLAVLEFRNKLAGAERKMVDVAYFSDQVRAASLKAAPSLRVITRENLLVLLQGKPLEECEGECEVETGRRVGADYVVSGEALKVGSLYKLNLKLHDTHDGRLLSGGVVTGKSVEELDGATARTVSDLLAPVK